MFVKNLLVINGMIESHDTSQNHIHGVRNQGVVWGCDPPPDSFFLSQISNDIVHFLNVYKYNPRPPPPP